MNFRNILFALLTIISSVAFFGCPPPQQARAQEVTGGQHTVFWAYASSGGYAEKFARIYTPDGWVLVAYGSGNTSPVITVINDPNHNWKL